MAKAGSTPSIPPCRVTADLEERDGLGKMSFMWRVGVSPRWCLFSSLYRADVMGFDNYTENKSKKTKVRNCHCLVIVLVMISN